MTAAGADGEPQAVSLSAAALACLRERDPDQKVALTRLAAADWRAGGLALEDPIPPDEVAEPGRPERPELVAPRDLAKRSAKGTAGGGQGRAALIHAVAHIEFNAINLAWDAVYRFRGLPRAYYDDWVGVAAEEALHFGLMRDRLRTLGHEYGDFPAHDGLWSMARRTAADPLARMALIPRVLEARGLDVTPGMIARLRSAGDGETADCLEVILRDEVGMWRPGRAGSTSSARSGGSNPRANISSCWLTIWVVGGVAPSIWRIAAARASARPNWRVCRRSATNPLASGPEPGLPRPALA